MIKFYSFFLSLLFLGIVLNAQVTGWSDDFNDNDLDTLWKQNPGAYYLAETGGELVITVTKQALWDGFLLFFPAPIDLSNHPYASFKIKADTAVDFRIYLWDKDSLYNQASSDVWVVPGDEYYTYYFNWEGKFLHGADRVEPLDSIWSLDSTQIAAFLINVDPGGEELYYGTLKFDDFMVGDQADLSTASAAITGATVGEVSATAIKEIPEGTTVGDLLAGLTSNGDITMLAAGNDGKAGAEAQGSDIVDGTMKIYVILDGSNPKKYDVLVAPPALPCYYREDFPTVDGEIDPVWETVKSHPLPHNLRNGTIDGPADLGAEFRTLWDEVSLFFLFKVVDDVEMVDSKAAGQPYSDDCVEIWLDLNNSKNSAYLPSETDEYQFVFSRGYTDSYFLDHHAAVPGVDWAWTNTANGYIFEVEMPWATSFEWQSRFGVNHPRFGHKIGMDVHVGDDDDGGDRDVNIGWFYETDEAWNDPSTLGVMVMREEIYESVPTVHNDFKFRLYPNPASDQLQVIGNAGISRVEIHNLIGQVVRSIPVHNDCYLNINITDLPNSVYLISVYDVNGYVHTSKLVKK